MMLLSVSLTLYIIVSCAAGAFVPIFVNVDKVLHETDSRFLSIALDCSLIGRHFKTFDASDPKVITLSKGLSPAILRLGGTACDYMIFNSTNRLVAGEYGFLQKKFGAILHIADWDKLVTLTHQANFTLLYDTNAMTRDQKDHWDPTNFKEFLAYNTQKGNKNLMFELGNEPNNWPVHFHKVNASQLAADFSLMRSIIKNSQLYHNNLVVGADVGNPYIRDLGLDPATYIHDFFKAGHNYIDALTWHQYYLKGSTAKVEDFLNVTLMDKFQKQVDIVSSIIKEVLGENATFPVWMGETSSAYDSGAPNISNTYVAGFLWMDKLGVSARSGYDIVIRQTFYDGWYSLIDHELNPLPDYWLSLLYKQLVGTKVLNVTVHGASYLRVYAHCTKVSRSYSNGEVTLYAMNVHSTDTVTIQPIMNYVAVDAYVLEPSDKTLQSLSVNLNGEPLQLENNTLPKLTPLKVGKLVLKPQTFGFFVLKTNLSICKEQ